MAELLLAAIFITAGLSLLSYIYCWQDIKSGRPHIITLRQITSIMDRHRLNAMFGSPQPGYYYPIPDTILKPMLAYYRSFYLSECLADSLCMLGAWRYMQHKDAQGQALFISLAFTCQAVNIIYSIWLIRKWGHQLREEFENSGE